MIFKKLCLEDKKKIDKYISPYKFLSCEYSFTSLFIWKEACDVQYSVYKNALILKKKDFDGNYYFMQPVGYTKENLGMIIEKLKVYRGKNDMKYLFKDLEESFIEELNVLLNGKNKFCIEEDRDNFDYLYEAKKLMTFSGKKLHSKKNHYNAFTKNYNYKVVEINDKRVINDVIFAAKKWYEETHEKDIKLYYEFLAIRDLVNNMSLLNLKGVAVYVDGKVAAFSIGESLSEKLAVIHIEKGDKNINGIYSFIAKTLIDKCFNNAEIINREQDLGIEGLRKSKMSYYPLKLEKKFTASIIF
ncbi:phosphatidylglycerol lysyltransferase domain-containing protein [Clostridium estertheticum]|uniref:DUF2156 domain-containing protein n=1 Tax=Clostridium estertheticum TaxID=238834 RepID=UPI001C0B22E9|nr:phosphatidylglycerol lysyltransferase domain-containing protein [Clostridium estertheticum]MBU3201097.1 DUF2156 domain-containing protein [Clostridium estertheticum]WAG66596.1 phosphatidylglycerol lysyltransferase domain-containing protein [Clostridium estertheticum]